MIVCLTIFAILVIIYVVCLVIGFNEDIETGGAVLVSGLVLLFFAGLFLVLPFVVLDRGSGTTIGTITSVDKNFFGTTAIYIKTSETEQEKYCAEDKKVINKAKKMIGKKVQISYGERIGFYHLNQCSQAPIERLDEVKGDKDE